MIAVLFALPGIWALFPEETHQFFIRYNQRVYLFFNKAREVDRDGRFIKLDNGVVYDAEKDLEWYVDPEMDKNITREKAEEWVKKLSLDGGGWRLPAVRELRSIYQPEVGYQNVSPLFKTTGWWIWSRVSEKEGLSSARFFPFLDGGSNWLDRYGTASYRVFAVRSRRC